MMKKIILLFISLIYLNPQSAFSQIKYFRCIIGMEKNVILKSLTYGIGNKKIYYPIEKEYQKAQIKDEWKIVNIDEFFDIITANSESSEIKLFGYISGKFSKDNGNVEKYYYKSGKKSYQSSCGFVSF
jgi:hypothetical protein